MLDVCFFEAFEEEERSIRLHLPPAVRAGFVRGTIQESDHAAPPARVISIRTQSIIPDAWAQGVDAILSRSTGYDHLTAYTERTGIRMACGYLPSYCARAVAEQAMLLWTALLRRLPAQVRNFRTFHRDGLTGRECQGKDLLVVGVGNIGRETIRIGQGLGMKPRGVDIVRRYAEVDYVDIAAGTSQADVIVCSMNLTAGNRGYFGDELLRTVRRGAVFINVARGEMSPSSTLLRLLDEGILGGVGLDVYNEEPALAVALRAGSESQQNPEVRATLQLAAHPGAILTPHNAFNTEESVDRKSVQAVSQVMQFLEDGTFVWPIPTEALS